MAKLTNRQRENLPKEMFALPEKRMFPISDKNHCTQALRMLDRADITPQEKAEAKKRIITRMKTLGMDTSGLTASISIAGGNALLSNEEYEPNHMPFSGILAMVDEPSSGPPHGLPPQFAGRPILLPADVAAEIAESFIGMGVNIRDDLAGHNTLQKVGIIDDCWVENNELRADGIIYDKDFPEQAAAIKAHKDELGMSFETAKTILLSGDYNGNPVAVIASMVGTGATILRKVSAAYSQTSLAAQSNKEADAKMEEELKQLLASVKTIGESVTALSASVTGLDTKFQTLEEKVGAVDAKVDDKVTSLSASLEALPKDGIKIDDITAAVETKFKEIVHAEIEASKKPAANPQRKTAPLPRYEVKEGEDIFAAISKSEGTTTEKITAKLLASLAATQAQAE